MSNRDSDLLHLVDFPDDCSYPEDELSDFYAELRKQYDAVIRQEAAPKQSHLYGSCICGFIGKESFTSYSVEGRESALERMHQKHMTSYKQCSANLMTFAL